MTIGPTDNCPCQSYLLSCRAVRVLSTTVTEDESNRKVRTGVLSSSGSSASGSTRRCCWSASVSSGKYELDMIESDQKTDARGVREAILASRVLVMQEVS